MERLFWLRALLLVALTFPEEDGLSSVSGRTLCPKRLTVERPNTLRYVHTGLFGTRHVNQEGADGPRAPRDEANDSWGLHRPGKRYLVPLTPQPVDYGRGFKVVNCRKSEGYCQEYCNYMEIQVGYCSERKDACCLPQN